MGQQPFTGQTHGSLCCLCLCVPVVFGWVTGAVLLPLGEMETNTAPPVWKENCPVADRILEDKRPRLSHRAEESA